jgi:hypothetical protein
MKKAIRIIDLVDSSLTSGTQLSVSSRKPGISFYLDQTAVFNIANDTVSRNTLPARRWDGLSFLPSLRRIIGYLNFTLQFF